MRPQKNSFLTIFAALMLLLQFSLPFFATYQLPAPTATQRASSIFGDKILICTADGFRFVSFADIISGKEKPKLHKQYQCPVCYVSAHNQIIESSPPAQITAPTFVVLASASLAFASEPNLATQHWRERLTRSPPHSFTV
jgi:hypothetical protein